MTALFQLLGRLARNRIFQAVLSLSIGGVFLWLAFKRTDIGELARNLGQVRTGWLAAAFASYWIALMLRSWRWQIILAPVRRLTFGQVFHGLLVGYAANYLLPARLGELVRANFLGRRYNLSRLSVIATIVVERLFDVIVFLGFIFAGLAAIHRQSDSQIAPILYIGEAVAAGCIILGAVLVILVKIRHKPLPQVIGFLEKPKKSLTEGLHLITGAPEVAVLIAATVVVWTADSLAVWLLCQALGYDLYLLPLLLIMGMSCLAALIPAAPANIGALQFALVEAFMLLHLHNPDLGGNSLALLTQGCFVMSCILVGGALYVRATLVAVRRRTG